ncbi:TrlF family AAA-like ATPase [Gulbenkiania mobilis]|uniref:TrlF family AAA-like ATPase n=1 Tax=Gulbenkiania mobilis TaxID=397457 RepID=UPI0006BBE26E|nr:AAA family ATPase [Gulbenkiania mobilis]
MSDTLWPHPGSRWWKFDFHTHTPASKDTDAWQKAMGTPDEITPEKWLLKYMAAEIDCVAVTDHNSGAWIDGLKAAYAEMKAQADAGTPPAGFREITIFPGVEISANGGVHVLALFDPSATTSDIDSLLGAVEYRGTKGDSDGETQKAVNEVIAKILEAGAIAIPAHVDRDKGLLRVNPGTRECGMSAATVKLALEVEGLLAVEWCDLDNPYPEAMEKLARPLARVLGSDCHSFQGAKEPGSAYTWVKMAKPTLEGLRLALLDGNGVSLRRSEEGSFDPFKTPAHVIRSITVEKAKVMGNGKPAVIEMSPYFNAIVGGRGTGKSTVVHALRLATRREAEIQALPKESEPRERFEAFRMVAKGRDDEGALKPDTAIRVEWQHGTTRLRLCWRDEGKAVEVEEWRDGQWQPSASQSVNAARFPLRIFSQGQIAAMAGGGRQALLAIIDEAAGVEPLKQAYEEAQRAFFAQRARLREIDGKLAVLPEVERRRQEVEGKLKSLSQADHAAVLQAFARAQHQQRAVDEALGQLREGAATLRKVANGLLLDDWLPQHFTEADADLLAWRAEADGLLARARQRLGQEAAALDEGIAQLTADARLGAWRSRADAAREQHQNLQTRLAAQGVADPQAFARLTQERQHLETQIKALRQMQSDRTLLVQQIEAQQSLVLERRRAITQQRQAFLKDKLAQNPHVRMSVVPFGFDAQVIERSLRELIEAADERFADDILKIEDGQATSGLAFDLATATADEKLAALDRTREAILQRPASLGGHFRNYLERKAQKPEFADHVLVWYPEDDLRIEYQRDNKWYAISEGSQGQRSAALLAFLLAFGEEPIVLDQPEDDLDNHLIYDLIVRQIRENKLRRQLIVVTHNPNVVVNGDAELVHVMEFGRGQCFVQQSGALQEKAVREEVCRVMEGGREAFARRWMRLGKEV